MYVYKHVNTWCNVQFGNDRRKCVGVSVRRKPPRPDVCKQYVRYCSSLSDGESWLLGMIAGSDTSTYRALSPPLTNHLSS